MQIGFGRTDITPRVGVELCGFGPFLNRHSIAVRDRLWARAMAVEQNGTTLILVSCDLIGVLQPMTDRVRALVSDATGVPPECIMVHCTHTHSGPSTAKVIGWGADDEPYRAVLAQRLAKPCIDAFHARRRATLAYAAVPCEGVALNREYDRDAPPLDEVLRDDWRPAKPELTDTTCHVFKIESEGRLVGFFSYFGCHPVVCCQETRYIHGDYAGVATNLAERDAPGCVGLFLQGAQGDVNSACVHKPEQDSLLALDVIAGRYARAVRSGLAKARPVKVDRLAAVRTGVRFPRKSMPIDRLQALLSEQESILDAPDATDADSKVRMATVNAIALREMIARTKTGEDLAAPQELQGFRLGPVALLGTPFEIFHAVKEDVCARAASHPCLVMGLTNDCCGYATDRTAAARGGYAADTVPMIIGQLPYAGIHDELVKALIDLDHRLFPASRTKPAKARPRARKAQEA